MALSWNRIHGGRFGERVEACLRYPLGLHLMSLALTCYWEKGNLFQFYCSSQLDPACFPFQKYKLVILGFFSQGVSSDALLLLPSASSYTDADALQALWLWVCPYLLIFWGFRASLSPSSFCITHRLLILLYIFREIKN